MQLAKALPDHRSEPLISGNRLPPTLVVGPGERRGMDAAPDPVERPLPGIALVVHEPLGDHERLGRAVGIHAHDLAEQRRAVGIAVLGEIPGHFGLRMAPRLDPPEDLQDRDLAEDQRGVGLFGRKPVDLRVPRRRWNLLAGRNPAQLAVRKRFRASRREARQDRRRQRIDGKGIREKAHPAVPAHARQRQLLHDRRRLLVVPDDAGRQEVAILPAIRRDPDLEEQEEVSGAPADDIGARDADRADLAVLGRKPAPSREIGRENLLFDDAFWLGRQQLSDLVPHDQRHKFGQRLGGRHAPGGHRRILRQAEPVEGMRRQG